MQDKSLRRSANFKEFLFAVICFVGLIWIMGVNVKADESFSWSSYLYIGGEYHYDLERDFSGDGWSYQAYPRKITLNNYNSSEIDLFITDDADDSLADLVMIGDNRITVEGHTNTDEYGLAGGHTCNEAIHIGSDGTLLITGGNSLFIDYRTDEFDSLPHSNTSYVNCGTITVVNNSGQKQFFPYIVDDGVYLYNTNIIYENYRYGYFDMNFYDDEQCSRCYNSSIVWSYPGTDEKKTFDKNDIIGDNATVYDNNGNVIDLKTDYMSDDGHDYFKCVYGDQSDFCIPGCLETYQSSATKEVLIRKCQICGDVMETYEIPVNNVSLSPSEYIYVHSIGETVQLSVNLIPSYASDKSITWTSEYPEIVSVSSTGLLTVKKASNSTIMITAKGSTWSDYFYVFYKGGNSNSSINSNTSSNTTNTGSSLPQANVINAPDEIAKAYSKASQTFAIGASCNGGAALSYVSNNPYITVNAAGIVAIPAKYMGTAVITITSTATANYNAAAKNVTISAGPTQTALSSAKNVKGKKMQLKWKKNKNATGYQIQIATDPGFTTVVKSYNISKNKTISKKVSGLAKGGVYYVRIRSYKKTATGNAFAPWSAAKKVKIKK